MSKRLDDFNKKFIYTDTNPENIIVAKKNAMFFRSGNEFYVNHSGVVNGKWEKLLYKTVIIPHPPKSKLIKYKKAQELWVKTTDGFFDEFEDLLPKTGWKFLSNQNIFAVVPTAVFSIKDLNWILLLRQDFYQCQQYQQQPMMQLQAIKHMMQTFFI